MINAFAARFLCIADQHCFAVLAFFFGCQHMNSVLGDALVIHSASVEHCCNKELRFLHSVRQLFVWRDDHDRYALSTLCFNFKSPQTSCLM